MYACTLQSLNRFGSKGQGNCSTNLQQYVALGRFNFYQSLERSNVIDQSGIPLSNSRLLTISQTWNTAPAAATLIDLFLFYSIMIRVFNSGANVEV